MIQDSNTAEVIQGRSAPKAALVPSTKHAFYAQVFLLDSVLPFSLVPRSARPNLRLVPFLLVPLWLIYLGSSGFGFYPQYSLKTPLRLWLNLNGTNQQKRKTRSHTSYCQAHLQPFKFNWYNFLTESVQKNQF